MTNQTSKRQRKHRLSDGEKQFRAEQFNRYFLLWQIDQRGGKDAQGYISLRDARAIVAEILYKCGITGVNSHVSLAGLSRGPRDKHYLDVQGTGTDMAWKLTPGFHRHIDNLGWLLQFERVAKAIDARTDRTPVDNLQLLPTIQELKHKEEMRQANSAAIVRQETTVAVNKAQAEAQQAAAHAKHVEESAARRVDEAEARAAALEKASKETPAPVNGAVRAVTAPAPVAPAPVVPAPAQAPATEQKVSIVLIQKFMAIVNEIGVDTAFELLATLDHAKTASRR